MDEKAEFLTKRPLKVRLLYRVEIDAVKAENAGR